VTVAAAVVLCGQGLAGTYLAAGLGYLALTGAGVTRALDLYRRRTPAREASLPALAGLLCLAAATWAVGLGHARRVGLAVVVPLLMLAALGLLGWWTGPRVCRSGGEGRARCPATERAGRSAFGRAQVLGWHPCLDQHYPAGVDDAVHHTGRPGSAPLAGPFRQQASAPPATSTAHCHDAHWSPWRRRCRDSIQRSPPYFVCSGVVVL
jgi:hypothetical protein